MGVRTGVHSLPATCGWQRATAVSNVSRTAAMYATSPVPRVYTRATVTGYCQCVRVRASELVVCTHQADVDVRRGLAERKVLLAVDGDGEHLQKERRVTRGIAMHRRWCGGERTEGSSWKMAAVPSPWWTSKSNTRTDVRPRCRTARRAATARSLMAVNPLLEWAVRTSTSRTK